MSQYDNKWGYYCENLYVEANLKEFRKGDIKMDEYESRRKPSDGNWSIGSKACMGCGYIVMFLPLRKMRVRKKKSEAAAKKKKEMKAAAKKKKEREAAAKKKKEREAEKERLKKRLAELEESE